MIRLAYKSIPQSPAVTLMALLLAILCWLGCGPTPFYEESHRVEPEGWSDSKAFLYEMHIADTTAKYDLHLIVDHLTSYSHENIYLQIKTSFPDRPSKTEQLNINFAEKSGQWVGKCSGEYCQLKVYLLEQFKFPSIGEYSFEIKQYTRDASLEGINELTMALYKV